MKIIYLANIRFPTEKAHGVHYAKMCEALGSQNHDVELVVGRRHNPKYKNQDPYYFYGIKGNFKIKKLFVIDLLRWIIKWGHLGTWLVNLSFAKSSFWYVLFKKADLIYSRDALPLLLISLVKKNFIYELHEYRAKDKKLYKRLARKGKGIVVITKSIKDLLVQDGIDENKILVAPDGVDLKIFNIQYSIFNIRQELALPKDKKIILYNGSLYKWKGVYDLVQITSYELRVTDYVIILVGGMPHDIDRLKKFIKEKKLPEDRIKILGHKPYKHIPAYLAAADVLVLPNSANKDISSLFTSPMKMFEYMAAQRPIVASDLPSIREVLNENNSILVESDNPENLAKGIEQALTNQGLVDSIVSRSFQDIQEYTWGKRVEKIIKFIS